jgi:hypothetical protein
MMNSSFPLNNDFRGPLKEDRWFETEKQKDLLREGQGETAGNLGPEYELISNSQDIAATLESIGRADEIDDWGCLFVKVGDGDYDAGLVIRITGRESNSVSILPHFIFGRFEIYLMIN